MTRTERRGSATAVETPATIIAGGVALGESAEVQRAKDRLDDAQATETTIHAEPAAVGAITQGSR